MTMGKRDSWLEEAKRKADGVRVTDTMRMRFDGTLVVGVDPGPEYSAFAAVFMSDGEDRLLGCDYVRNYDFRRMTPEEVAAKFYQTYLDDGLFPVCGTLVAAVETVSFRGAMIGSTTLATCMMAGEIMSKFRGAAEILRFTPSEWRHVVCGRGNANDSAVRASVNEFLPGADGLIRKVSADRKKKYGLRKACTGHMRDAAGVALAVAHAEERVGKSPRAWSEDAGEGADDGQE